MKTRQRLELGSPKPRSAKGYQLPPEAGRDACKRFSLKSPDGTNAADTLISDFWPPEL